MHEKRFHGDAARLRSPERVRRLSVEKIIDLSLEGLRGTNGPVRVLDVGTGSALFAEHFAARGCAVAGVDADPAMVKLAAEHVPSGIFRHGIAETLPFPDSSYDLVFMGFVFHETDEPVATLREAARAGTQRISIAEWPYRTEEFGPPIEHRLDPAKVLSWMQEAGLADGAVTELEHVLLYTARIPG